VLAFQKRLSRQDISLTHTIIQPKHILAAAHQAD
jgi:hypothetical protein